MSRIVPIFIMKQFGKVIGYESLNTARGALSALGLKFEGFRIGNHPLVIRYMKRAYAAYGGFLH